MIHPFNSKFSNAIDLYNEITMLLCFSVSLFMTRVELDSKNTSIIGWVLIGLVIISLLTAWYTTIPQAIRFFKKLWIKFYAKFFKSKKNKKAKAKTIKLILASKDPQKKVKKIKLNATN